MDNETHVIDDFSKHEVLHTTSMLNTIFDDWITTHPFVQSDDEIRLAAGEIVEKLGNFYQLVGRKTL